MKLNISHHVVPNPDCHNNKLKSGINNSYYRCTECKKTYDVVIPLQSAQKIIEKEVAYRESPFYDAIKRNQEVFGKY